MSEIIGELSFNRDDQKGGQGKKVVSVDADSELVYISFDLGITPDDGVNLTFPLEEFMAKVGRAIAEQENQL